MDFYKKYSEPRYLLMGILFIGILLRLWGLGSAEIFHDEGYYAFRSIGYADYIQNENQTTPIQWFKDVQLPWWIGLSFHDHPPLYFFIQHIFFQFFGDSFFAARLPSFLAGSASIYFAYLLGKRFFKNDLSAVLTAAILAFNHIHIWISRSSLMEGLLVLAVFWNIYNFLNFLDNHKKWHWFGVSLGICALIKYTSGFLLPAYFIYLLVFNKKILGQRQWWLALMAAALVFSPVIIYNIQLYQAVGHFDLQIAYLFGQNTPEWTGSVGKIQNPFGNIIFNLTSMYSLPFLLAVIFSAGYLLVRMFIDKKLNSDWVLLILFLFLITLMLVKIGSAYRFISLYIIPAIFLIGSAANNLQEKFKGRGIFSLLVIFFLLYEIFFAIGGIFLEFPDFGIAKLDRYLNSEFGNYRSAVLPASTNPHLNLIIRKYGLRFPPSNRSSMIVYDENLDLSAKLWIFGRRNLYKGIPTLTVDQFNKFFREMGPEAFSGYEVYFVKASEHALLNPYIFSNSAKNLEEFLKTNFSLAPEKVIYGYNGWLMFSVYKIKF